MTSTIITIVISVLLVIAIGSALVKGIWTVSKKITIPIQIALFLVMLLCVVRLFCTKENAQKLYNGIEQTGIAKNVENTMRTALNIKSSEVETSSKQQAVQVAQVVPAVPVSDSIPEQTQVKQSVVQVVAIDRSASQVSEDFSAMTSNMIAHESHPMQIDDYSHLDKGKKSFSFALPFNAKVTVGFKDNTYRVMAESLGTLDASDKKEIGRLIFTSLGKYIGKEVKVENKSKISIKSRYDEADGYTRIFAIIPPDAIN